MEWMPPANAQPGRGTHHGREHDREKRGDVKQDQDTAQQPRKIEGQHKSECEDDIAANA